jgi:hypothetical protein
MTEQLQTPEKFEKGGGMRTIYMYDRGALNHIQREGGFLK